jgi:hypothetical protein
MPTIKLDNRLNAYFSALNSRPAADALKRSTANWQYYAAVTGSAMAMATTNASAAIIYDGSGVTVGPHASVLASTSFHSTGAIKLKNGTGAFIGVDFGPGIFQRSTGAGNQSGSAVLKGTTAGFRMTLAHFKLRKFSFGSNVDIAPDALSVWEGGTVKMASRSNSAAGGHLGTGWASNKTYFAGFFFGGAANMHYGWIRLKYTLGSNGLPNSAEAIDWAYNSTPNGAITAGQGIPTATPEPSTLGLGLLAAGAAGVAAIRRRKQASA